MIFKQIIKKNKKKLRNKIDLPNNMLINSLNLINNKKIMNFANDFILIIEKTFLINLVFYKYID
jgi:hypothetical protein